MKFKHLHKQNQMVNFYTNSVYQNENGSLLDVMNFLFVFHKTYYYYFE
jgi:hypothetical protein